MNITIKNVEDLSVATQILAIRSAEVWLKNSKEDRKTFIWTCVTWDDEYKTKFYVRQTAKENLIIEKTNN